MRSVSIVITRYLDVVCSRRRITITMTRTKGWLPRLLQPDARPPASMGGSGAVSSPCSSAAPGSPERMSAEALLRRRRVRSRNRHAVVIGRSRCHRSRFAKWKPRRVAGHCSRKGSSRPALHPAGGLGVFAQPFGEPRGQIAPRFGEVTPVPRVPASPARGQAPSQRSSCRQSSSIRRDT